MRWLRRKVAREQEPALPAPEAPPRPRRSDPIPDTLYEQRNRTIHQCRTLLGHIDNARDRIEAATAALTRNRERPGGAWTAEVLQAIDRVVHAANSVNRAAPPGRQLPYRYLKRIRAKLLARDTSDSVTIAQFAAYQEGLATLRRDTERLRSALLSENTEVPRGTG